jgi:hypothetical protein
MNITSIVFVYTEELIREGAGGTPTKKERQYRIFWLMPGKVFP